MKKLLVIFLFISLLLVSCDYSFKKTEVNYHYTLTKDSETGKVYSCDCDYVVCLEKKDEDFVILNLADIQQSSGNLSSCLVDSVKELVEQVKPDLITVSGDISFGSGLTVISVGKLLDSFDIPWAPIFGNHDHDVSFTSIQAQCKLFSSFDNCIFKVGPDMGTTVRESPKLGNYVINIIENSDEDFRVVKSLVLMDTGSSYDKLNDKQVKFYNQSMESVQSYGSNGKVDSVLVIHIPIYEYRNAINNAYKAEYLDCLETIDYQDSFNDEYWNQGYEDSFGVVHENPSGPSVDDFVFDRIKDTVDCIISAHDHYNNCVIEYRGVKFCYSMKTGDGSSCDTSMIGGTVLKINANGEVEISHSLHPLD